MSLLELASFPKVRHLNTYWGVPDAYTLGMYLLELAICPEVGHIDTYWGALHK